MKNLKEHNEEAYKRFMQPQDNIFGRGAGVLCPKCGIEMGYSDTGADVVLACWPPKRRVHCMACGHNDYKVSG